MALRRLVAVLGASALTLVAGASGAMAAPLAGSTLIASRPAGFGALVPALVNDSSGGALSDDGRYVAFVSNADGIFPGTADDAASQIYLRDNQTGAVTLVSRADGPSGAIGNGDSSSPSIAITDQTPAHVIVAFSTRATNLTDHDYPSFQDTNGHPDVYVRDVTGGETLLASIKGPENQPQSNGESEQPTIAIRGTGTTILDAQVAFRTYQASNLGGSFPPNTPTEPQVYVRNLAMHQTYLVSCESSCTDANEDNRVASQYTIEGADKPMIAANGGALVYQTDETSITGGLLTDTHAVLATLDGNGRLSSQKVVSRASDAGMTPGALGNDNTDGVAINRDGTRVAFDSKSTNLTTDGVPGGATFETYLRKVDQGTTTLISRASGTNGAIGDANGASGVAIDGTGDKVAFLSKATTLGVAGAHVNAWLRDLGPAPPTTTLLSRAAGPGGTAADGDTSQVALSGDGLHATLTAPADRYGITSPRNISPDDDDDFSRVFQRDLTNGAMDLVSRPAGAPQPFRSGVNASSSGGQAVSSDGRYVAFVSRSDDLSNADDNRVSNVYVRDMLTGAVTLVSRASGAGGAGANADAAPPAISADGRRVAFASTATNLGGGAPAGTLEVYVRDLGAQKTTLVSRANGAGGSAADTYAVLPSIDADGRRVAFLSSSTLDGGGGRQQVFVRDLGAGTTTLASRADGAAGAAGDQSSSGAPSLDADGRRVAFTSQATNISGPNSNQDRAYVRDLGANTTELVGRGNGPTGAVANADSQSVDAAGRRVAFTTRDDLGGGHSAGDVDIYVRDTTAKTTTFVGHGFSGAGNAFGASLDAAGQRVALVAYPSTADASTPFRVYVHDVVGGGTQMIPGALSVTGYVRVLGLGGGGPPLPSLSANGDCVAFVADAPSTVPGSPGPDFPAVFEHVLRRECPVDLPHTTIGSGPSGPTGDSTPTFAFSSNEPGSSFRCTIDGVTVATCSSPFTTPALADGRHTFSVRATDGAGFQDPATARRTFVVDTTAPIITKLSVSPSRFRVSKTATSARKKKRGGARIKLRLSERAVTRFTIRRCQDRRCRKTKAVGKFRRNLAAGAVRVPFSGRVGKKALKAGRYKIAVVATDAVGHKSSPAATKFQIIGR